METLKSTNSTSNKSPIPMEIISIDLDRIDIDDKDAVKALLQKLINFIEQLLHNNQKQEEEIQKLNNKINQMERQMDVSSQCIQSKSYYTPCRMSGQA